MREILELCVQLDRMAYDAYRALSDTAKLPELTTVFDQMAKEERTHVDWWSDLLVAWEGGLVPDIADEHDLLVRLTEIRDDLVDLELDDIRETTDDCRLELAVKMEFFMLDPAFGELVDLMQPGGKVEIRHAYSRHVLRLIEAVENHYSHDSLAPFLAEVLRRSYRDQQRLASLAARDQLTGLYNRRGLLGYLSQWMSWAERYHRPLGVALVDVDHFKKINDTYGHPVGDEALRAIAVTLAETVRSADVVGRFGGDEFLVIAPESGASELSDLMGRLAAAVARTPLSTDAGIVALSVSVGAAWTEGGSPASSERLLAKADQSLYGAKAAGRGRAGDPLAMESKARAS